MNINAHASSQTSQASKSDLGQKAPMALPSNYCAGIVNAKKIFNEEVGNAIAEVVRGSNGKSLAEPMWVPKPAEDVASQAV